MKKMAISKVFGQHAFVEVKFSRYPNDPWMIPALGLPGCIDIKDDSLLHLEMTDEAWDEAKKFCLNGVINKIRFHISARMDRPDTVLVLVSDLLSEYEFCQIPFVSNVEELIKGIK